LCTARLQADTHLAACDARRHELVALDPREPSGRHGEGRREQHLALAAVARPHLERDPRDHAVANHDLPLARVERDRLDRGVAADIQIVGVAAAVRDGRVDDRVSAAAAGRNRADEPEAEHDPEPR
jgi:hypothetical protein